MTIYTDEIKQLEKIVEMTRQINSELMGHNGDCYCDFCTGDQTKMIQEECIQFWFKMKQRLDNLTLCMYCQVVENKTCDHMEEIEPCVKCKCLSRDHSQDDKGQCLNCDCDGLETA